MASRFKSEAKWVAAVEYLLLAAGLLVALLTSFVRWVGAAG